MPNPLHRYYGAGYLHFITTSCHRRRALLGSAQNRELFLAVMEQVRRRYRFVVVGYVVMPEHAHLLFSEPERGNPSAVMQAIKQGLRAVCCSGCARGPILDKEHCGVRRWRPGTSGSAAFMILWYSARRKKWRNFAICTATRWCADWCSNRDSGRGAAFGITRKESGAWSW